MRGFGWRCVVLMLVVVGGCDRGEKDKEEVVRVARVAVVNPRAYEEGYGVGLVKGEASGRPLAKLPPEAEVAGLAGVEGGEVKEGRDRWERGFVAGYFEGFRKVVTGQK